MEAIHVDLKADEKPPDTIILTFITGDEKEKRVFKLDKTFKLTGLSVLHDCKTSLYVYRVKHLKYKHMSKKKAHLYPQVIFRHNQV